MTQAVIDLVQALAQRRSKRLAPDWAADLDSTVNIDDAQALATLASMLGWQEPHNLRRRPRAHDFPLLAFVPDLGWGLAEQWQNSNEIRLITGRGIHHVAWDDIHSLIDLEFPSEAIQMASDSAFGIFWGAVMRRRRMLGEATLATVVVNIVALATSIYSMQVYDRVIPRGGFSTLWVLTAGMLFALVIDFMIRNARAFLIEREATVIDSEVSEYFFSRMQSVRLDARPQGVGTMAAQLRGLDQVRSIMASASLFVLADLPFALIFIVVMAMIGGVVALIPLIVFPLSIVAALVFSKLIREDTDQAQVTGNRKNGLLVEALDASETIKANQGSWYMLSAWNRLVEEVHLHDVKVRRWSTLAGSSFSLLSQFAYVAIVAWGAYLVSESKLTMGGLIACTIISGRISGPLVASLPNLVVQWGYAKSSLRALDKLLDLPSEHPEGEQKIKLDRIQGTVNLANVAFTHPGTRAGVQVAKLEIQPGERIGIIGPVGSGKSTLLRLLSGLYTPQQGHVLLDGIDITHISEDSLRCQVCYQPQDYRLLSGTLRDNLALGLPDPRDDLLMDAAVKTGLADLIRAHPKGLDLPIAEGGRGLSGGQRTLVGLTRALLARPRLLLLDEPTANLDPDSEATVLRALLDSLAPDTTLVLVTHKMQLLTLVRRLILVNAGSVALDGPTQSVLAQLQPKKTKKDEAPAQARTTVPAFAGLVPTKSD